MFLVTVLLFIVLMATILVMMYRNERASSRRALPRGKAEEYWDGKERRKHTRFRKTLDVNYSIRKKSRNNNRSNTADISEGGVKMLLYEKLPVGAALDMKIPVSSSSRPINVVGEVMWTEEAPRKDISGKRLFYSGVMFRASDDQPYKFLISYVRSLRSDETG